MVLNLLMAFLVVSAVPDDSVWYQLRARYSSLTSLSGEFRETMHPWADTSSQTLTGTFAILMPDRYRIEVAEPHSQTIVGNDSTFWFYLAAQKHAVCQIGETGVPLLAFLEPMTDTTATATVTRDSTGRIVLEISEPDSGYVLANFAFTDFKFRLDSAAQKIAAFSFTDAWRTAFQFEFHNQKWNPGIPAKTFEFVPPAGTAIDSIRR